MHRYLKWLLSMLSALALLEAGTTAHATTVSLTLTTSPGGVIYMGTLDSSTWSNTANGAFSVDSFDINAIDENGIALVFDSSASAILENLTNVSSGDLQIVNNASGSPDHLYRAPGSTNWGLGEPFVGVSIPIAPNGVPQTGYDLSFNNFSNTIGTFTLSNYIYDGTNITIGGIYASGNYELSVAAPSSVPLPATLPLFATGLGALGLLGWRRKKKAAAPAA